MREQKNKITESVIHRKSLDARLFCGEHNCAWGDHDDCCYDPDNSDWFGSVNHKEKGIGWAMVMLFLGTSVVHTRNILKSRALIRDTFDVIPAAKKSSPTAS